MQRIWIRRLCHAGSELIFRPSPSGHPYYYYSRQKHYYFYDEMERSLSNWTFRFRIYIAVKNVSSLNQKAQIAHGKLLKSYRPMGN